MAKHIDFHLLPPVKGRVTQTYLVTEKDVKVEVDNEGRVVIGPGNADIHRALGFIEWFTRWRCYIFSPREGTVYERTCLRDLADFCEEQTKAQRASAKARR